MAVVVRAASGDALLPAPGPARAWLRQELSGPEYHRSLIERISQTVQDFFDRIREATLGAGGFHPVAATVVLVVLVVLGAVVLSRLRANPAVPSSERALFPERRLTAADHRALARRALESGDWDTAVVESTRALASSLVERDLVLEDPGVTADEITARAAQLFPHAGDRLRRLALVFDETMYGGRRADERRAHEVAALEHELQGATPARNGGRGVVTAVPR